MWFLPPRTRKQVTSEIRTPERQNIRRQIDELFRHDGSRIEQIKTFTLTVYENYKQAVVQSKRGQFLFLLAWWVFYGIQADIIGTVSLGPASAHRVKSFTLAAPLLLGWLFYYIALSITAAGYLRVVIENNLKHMLPKAHEMGLARLMLVPTMFGTEYYVGEQSHVSWLNTVTKVWLWVIRLALIIGGFLVFAHGVWIAWTTTSVSLGWKALVTIVGATCWLRGFVLLITLSSLIGGTRYHGPSAMRDDSQNNDVAPL